MTGLMIPRAARMDWETPSAVFGPLDVEFCFSLDAAASQANAKCALYYSEDDDGLAQSWAGHVVWCNPPYGHDRLWRWVEKAHRESLGGATVVMLVPAYTATHWWHTWATQASEIRFVKGKIRFVGAKDRAAFASVILVFRPQSDSAQRCIAREVR